MPKFLAKAFTALFQFLTPLRVFIIAAAAAFFWFVVLGDQGIWRLERLLEMQHTLTAERQSLNDEIDELTQEKEVLADPANLETAIRSELGYIRPGEVLFEEKREPAPTAER
jgi:cell division protein FtsB